MVLGLNPAHGNFCDPLKTCRDTTLPVKRDGYMYGPLDCESEFKFILLQD